MRSEDNQARCRQRGAAIAETFVLLLVMIPLLLTIPMIGKLIDLKQTTHQASRYLAWERALSPLTPSTTIITERFFRTPDLPILSESDGQLYTGHNPLWGQSTGASETTSGPDTGIAHHADLIVLRDEVLLEVQGGADLPDSVKPVVQGINATASMMNFLDTVDWNLQANGMFDPRIEVEVETGVLFKSITGRCGDSSEEASSAYRSVCLSSSNAILTDGWGAGSNRQAERRSRAFVPAAVLEPAGRAVALLGAIPVVEELSDLKTAFGHVDPAQLPLDRYANQ